MPATLPLVFVSYAEEDSAMARQVASALKVAGFATWLYQENSLPGESYLQQIHSAVSHSDVVAVLLSVSSLSSHQVDKELTLGHDLGKPFMPVLFGITHDEVRSTKPEYGVVLGASVSIPVSEEVFTDALLKIVQGLHALVNKPRSTFAALDVAGLPTTPKVPDVPDEWEQLSRRLENFHPEITRIRQWLHRRWPESSAKGSESSLNGATPAMRVRIADELLTDLVDVVSQEWSRAPRDFALVARGGFGRGVLSVGSDIDVTLVHVAAETEIAEAFWGKYGTALSNCWSAVRGVRTAPIILTEEDCRKSWSEALDEDDLAPLVSFAFSRLVTGNENIHVKLRATWRDFVREMSSEQQSRIFNKLQHRVERQSLDPAIKRFNIKADAGGLLEYRLTGFCEQWLDVMSPGVEHPNWSDPTSHHFLLNLRESVFNLTRAHVLSEAQIPRVAETLFSVEPANSRVASLIEETARHRRRIRAKFKGALESCLEVASC